MLAQRSRMESAGGEMVGERDGPYSTDSVRGREDGRALLVALPGGSPADGARGRRRSLYGSLGGWDIL